MKKCVLYISILPCFLSCIQEQKTTGRTEQVQAISSKDQEILKHLKEVDWPKAYREQDTVLLHAILGDDFQMIDASGNWTTKRDELDWIKTNTTQQDSFFYEIKRLDILPNGTALLCGTGHIFNDSLETTYQSSNVLIKREGTWKAVSSHVSGLKKVD